MKKPLPLATLAVLLGGLITPLSAEDDGPPPPPRERPPHHEPGEDMKDHFMENADTDKSGSISLKEMEDTVLERTRERFAKLDADHNGEVTKEEMDAARPPRGPRPDGDRPHGPKGPQGPKAAHPDTDNDAPDAE